MSKRFLILIFGIVFLIGFVNACNPPQPECTINSDCGPQPWTCLGNFCGEGGNVWQNVRYSSCVEGQCVYETGFEFMWECSYGCENGMCTNPECYENSDCGEEILLNNYCVENDLYGNYSIPSCNQGECETNSEQKFEKTCVFGCFQGACIEEIPGICGNGLPDAGEQCDLGPFNGIACDNSEQDCWYCSLDCQIINLESEEQEKPEEESETGSSLNTWTTDPEFCYTSWKCSGWSECQNGIQTRNCIDKNNCLAQYNKPVETRGCDLIKESLVEPEKSTNWFLISSLILTILLLVVLGMIIFRTR